MNILEGLNEIQQQAVTTIDGPMMIIAGPGSGKTRVITYRIAYLIQQGIDPFNILALTFTNKAANEMRERIEQLVGAEARNLWMGTFHSVFARVLRQEAHRIGYPTGFSIYDTEDSRSLIKTIVKEKGLNDTLYKPNIVHYRISAAKNNLITPEDYEKDESLISEDEVTGRPKIIDIYKAYCQRCFMAGAMDFDDLLLKMYQLLENYPDVLYKYQHRFKYILVDEYQDTNFCQYMITRKLADVFQNICVVGDDAQSIYSFRGANIHNILNFEKDFPDLKVFRLEQNYRSTKRIVNAANHLISHNKLQLTKQIWTANETGEKIRVIRAMSDTEEGRQVANAIFELKARNHYRNNDFVILYRTNAQSRAFEEALRKLNIPYTIYGGISFYQRKEVKDLIAYLKLTVNPADEQALRRIINYPRRGIGSSTLDKITVLAAESGKSMWEVVENIHQYKQISAAIATRIENFATQIKCFRVFAEKYDAYTVAQHIAKTTGLLAELYSDKTPEGLSRYENIQELLNSIKEFTEQDVLENDQSPHDKSLSSYLQQITLMTDQDLDKNESDTVKLMTVHSAKGLEFPCVFIVGLEEGLFPHQMSCDTREDLEEERRLFYVAITRAARHLFIFFSASRFRYGNLTFCEPSRFIGELPQEDVEFIGIQAKPQKPVASSGFNPPNYKRPQYKTTTSYKPEDKSFKPDDTSTLQPGMEVEHQRFGMGKVLNIEGAGTNRIATIFFTDAGQKRIMLKYAKLRICNSRISDN